MSATSNPKPPVGEVTARQRLRMWAVEQAVRIHAGRVYEAIDPPRLGQPAEIRRPLTPEEIWQTIEATSFRLVQWVGEED